MVAASDRVIDVALLVVLLTTCASSAAADWADLDHGLRLGTFAAVTAGGDSLVVRALDIDPERVELRLLMVSEVGGEPRTLAQWAETYGLLAAINPSMYQEDLRRSVSLMQTREHVNNAYVSRDRCVLAFDPIVAGVPPVELLDRECDELETARRQYGSLVQSIRMISCAGANVWSPSERRHSTAAVGITETGHLLFVHVRARAVTNELIDVLRTLPLGIERLMYAEGGHQAQMLVNTEGGGDWVGLLPPGIDPDGESLIAWPLPNVLGIVPRAEPSE